MKPLSVAVAGCGVAGLAAALLLARAGHGVAIVDRMAAPGPVGSGLVLQPVGLAVLRRMGLEADILALGQRLARLSGRTLPSGRVVLDVRYAALGGDAFGLAVHRAALFEVLHGAVLAERVAFEMGFEVAAIDRRTDGRPALLSGDGRRLGPFDMVLDTLGARSALASEARRNANGRDLPFGALWATVHWPASSAFDPHALEQRYVQAHTMIGVLPIGRRPGDERSLATFFWSMKPMEYGRWREAGLDAWKARVLALWPATAPLIEGIRHPDDLLLARYGHHTLPVPTGARVAHLGDSAHSTSPQLGQGANMALLDALAFAEALDAAPDVDAALESYRRLRGFHVRLYQAASHAFTPFYQSDSAALAWIRDRVAAPISRWPLARGVLAKLVAGELGRPLRRMRHCERSEAVQA